jgi:quaternary ammonium compound-resistance protein SugE
MPWAYLAAAAICEVAFAMSMKYADGFTRTGPSILAITGAIIGITFLTLATKTLPVSVVYPIWTAFGTLGTVGLGWALFHEPLNSTKLLSAGAIVVGVIGLKLASEERTANAEMLRQAEAGAASEHDALRREREAAAARDTVVVANIEGEGQARQVRDAKQNGDGDDLVFWGANDPWLRRKSADSRRR